MLIIILIIVGIVFLISSYDQICLAKTYRLAKRGATPKTQFDGG